MVAPKAQALKQVRQAVVDLHNLEYMLLQVDRDEAVYGRLVSLLEALRWYIHELRPPRCACIACSGGKSATTLREGR